MEKKRNNKTILSMFISIIIGGGILYAGTIILGVYVQSVVSADLILPSLIINAIMFLILIYHFALYSSINNRYKKMKTNDYLNMIEKSKKVVEDDYEMVRKKVYRRRIFELIYSIAFFILVFVSLFLLGMGASKGYSLKDELYSGMFSFYIGAACFAYMAYLITFINDKVIVLLNSKDDIYSRDYKKTYEFIKDIFNSEGIEKKVKVNLIGDIANCYISEDKKHIYISIGIPLLKFLNKDELRSIIYHEIAHFKNKDTKYSLKIANTERIINWFIPKSLIPVYLPYALMDSINLELLDLLSKKYYEELADEEVFKKSDGKIYAEACVKMFGLEFALTNFNAYVDYLNAKNAYKWNKELLDKYFNGTLETYNKHIEFFDTVSKKQLETRIETHPNVRLRRERFYKGELDLSLMMNNDFDEDIMVAYENVNRYVENEIKNHRRKSYFLNDYEEYLKMKNDEYIESIKDDVVEINRLLDLAMRYGDYDFAEPLCLRQLELDGDHLRANYALGCIYTKIRHLEKGIPYLEAIYKAGNNFFAESAFQIIGEFYVDLGMEDKRDELRKIQATELDRQMEYEKVLTFYPNDVCEPYENEEVINKINSLVEDNEDIVRVVIATKRIGDNHCVHVSLMVKKDYKSEDEIEKTRVKVFNYLDVVDDEFRLWVVGVSAIHESHKLYKKPYLTYKRDENKN